MSKIMTGIRVLRLSKTVQKLGLNPNQIPTFMYGAMADAIKDGVINKYEGAMLLGIFFSMTMPMTMLQKDPLQASLIRPRIMLRAAPWIDEGRVRLNKIDGLEDYCVLAAAEMLTKEWGLTSREALTNLKSEMSAGEPISISGVTLQELLNEMYELGRQYAANTGREILGSAQQERDQK